MEVVEERVKVCLIGDSSVGKTSLFVRFFDDRFEDQLATIGMDYRRRKLNLDGRFVELSVWDTAGQERFQSTPVSFYNQADALVIVFDVTTRHSFERVEHWLGKISRHGKLGVVKVLVGNKVDLSALRVVSDHEAQVFASQHGMLYTPTSCKLGVNIESLFSSLARRTLLQRELNCASAPLEPSRVSIQGAKSSKVCPC